MGILVCGEAGEWGIRSGRAIAEAASAVSNQQFRIQIQIQIQNSEICNRKVEIENAVLLFAPDAELTLSRRLPVHARHLTEVQAAAEVGLRIGEVVVVPSEGLSRIAARRRAGHGDGRR
jgi:hypothetical protein